ncbi:MAG: helix-turn-helix domain-containing protein [Flavobacteriales bacterium]|jgi:transcriptional regulator with XRE-family HTH domain|uniref:helix-turn-helix domain-containing protein n=1 Tax=Candidatus Ulvibacter alkanivorans TaxID=2267620 RepID=UPI000DF27D61|nr:helix-turn-helix transcriptional regulator [Candidatus Ulvibacter alkanivorans]MCH2489289.1 helix-turn-helix domain-containing protein [Flavobacteriales bacterium]
MISERNKYKEKFLKLLGANVKKVRENKGLSQFKLSIEADIPKNQVGRIERGEINTSIFTLKRIADALQVEVIEFLQK